jgi:integrase
MTTNITFIEDEKERLKKILKENTKGHKYSRSFLRQEVRRVLNPVKVKGWDYEIPYEKTKKFLTNLIDNFFEYLSEDIQRAWKKHNYLKMLYFVMMLIQLKNGLRNQETWEATLLFLNDKETMKKKVVYIRVRKKKETKKDGKPRPKDEIERRVKLPSEISKRILEYLSSSPIIKELWFWWNHKDPEIRKEYQKRLQERYSKFVSNHFIFSTHALRHSFLTYLLKEKNINPVVVSKVTKHSDVNILKEYTSQKAADELLDLIAENKL